MSHTQKSKVEYNSCTTKITLFFFFFFFFIYIYISVYQVLLELFLKIFFLFISKVQLKNSLFYFLSIFSNSISYLICINIIGNLTNTDLFIHV